MRKQAIRKKNTPKTDIDDFLDTVWFSCLVRCAARDYSIHLTDRGLKTIRRVLKKKLPDAVYNAFSDTKVFTPVLGKYP